MVKTVVFLSMMIIATISAVRAYNWSKRARTLIPPFQVAGLVFMTVCTIAIGIIVVLDKLGLYPR